MGFFRRKDKKSKTVDEEIEEMLAEKNSVESSRGSPVQDAGGDEAARNRSQTPPGVQMTSTTAKDTPNKLQKKARNEASLLSKETTSRPTSRERSPKSGFTSVGAAPVNGSNMRPRRVEEDAAEQDRRGRSDSIKLVSSETGTRQPSSERNGAAPVRDIKPVTADKAPAVTNAAVPATTAKAARGETVRSVDGPMDPAQLEPLTHEDMPPKRGTVRAREPLREQTTSPPTTHAGPGGKSERLSESPVEVDRPAPTQSESPPLTSMNASTGVVNNRTEPSTSPPASTPEMVDASEVPGSNQTTTTEDDPAGAGRAGTPSTATTTTTTQSTTTSPQPTWDDAALRAFFDDGQEIRDLLQMVYHATPPPPWGPEHPFVKEYLREEREKVAELTEVCILYRFPLISILFRVRFQDQITDDSNTKTEIG